MLILKHNIIAIIVLIFILGSCRKSDIVVDKEYLIKDDGNGLNVTTWTKNNVYMLDGFVFVNPGQTLTIEAGTVIKAKTGQGENASALIIARGGKIIAEGTIEEPIIFTVDGDDLEGSVPIEARGLWGGIIILGNAQLNNEFNEARIEGIPQTEPRGIYGGSINNDNSGILRYVSIRHGGTNIGEGNEINGLTLGGVGSGTIIEYIEVISNQDDGFEFFGGTVNCKYLVSAFCGDDAFDFDEGYHGKGQFWLALQSYYLGDHLAEHDGGTDPVYGQPYCIPEIYNATYIGNGLLTSSELMTFADNAGGKYFNSIFLNQKKGVGIEYVSGSNDSYHQLEIGNLKVEKNIFYNVVDQDSALIFSIISDNPGDYTSQENTIDTYFIQNNEIFNPGIDITNTYVDIVPDGIVNTNLAIYPTEWFDEVTYKGAFDPEGLNWLYGWSLLYHSGRIQ